MLRCEPAEWPGVTLYHLDSTKETPLVRLLTPNQVSEVLSVKPATVRKWIQAGKIPAVKLGRMWRINEADLFAIADRPAPEPSQARGRRALERLAELGVK